MKGSIYTHGKLRGFSQTAQVRDKLPKVFAKAKTMYKTDPLSIQEDAKVNDQCGFKAWFFRFEINLTMCFFKLA